MIKRVYIVVDRWGEPYPYLEDSIADAVDTHYQDHPGEDEISGVFLYDNDYVAVNCTGSQVR